MYKDKKALNIEEENFCLTKANIYCLCNMGHLIKIVELVCLVLSVISNSQQVNDVRGRFEASQEVTLGV